MNSSVRTARMLSDRSVPTKKNAAVKTSYGVPDLRVIRRSPVSLLVRDARR